MKTFKNLMFAISLVALMSCGGSPAVSGDCAGNGCTGNNGTCVDDSAVSPENPVIENIMSRRSIRKYKQQPVGREVLDKIIECGINAPNGQNKQSWEVRVTDNTDFQNAIKAVMSATGNERAAGCFYNAPVWVFIARDKSYDFSSVDCGLLAGNMMLSAHSLGVGSVCLGSPVRFILESPEKETVLSMLGFSDGYELCLCIAMGYPEDTPEAKPRDIGKAKYID